MARCAPPPPRGLSLLQPHPPPTPKSVGHACSCMGRRLVAVPTMACKAGMGCRKSGWAATRGMSGFHFRGGGGGSIEPPKTGGGGFGKRAQSTGTINQSL